ncbi:unnamed protein product [Brassicogethes aeneus]|uniref:Fcf2 pre-rRNA processing C-terminal domain-containing protein n=1 Tax=Brassicogethes aeneus TaxID=1431903 RepID=A0A9P0FDJ7_BRAAE|nr:unnamed protein product [Brassicogethes aeneus]
MNFVIDIAGDSDIEDKNYGKVDNEKTLISDKEKRFSFVQELLKDYKDDLKKQNKKKPITPKQSSMTDDFIKSMGWVGNPDKPKQKKKSKFDEINTPDVSEVLKKSVVTEDFEKLYAVPRYDESEKKLKEQRKKEREKTKGKKWYGLPATEVTDEVKSDLEVIQMRSVLDPKHFYKKNDLKVLPKYFQIGKVMDSPLDYYNNRLTKKERKKTLVDELLADAEFNKYNKRKFMEIIEEKKKTHYKAWRQAKKIKKNK